MVILLQSTVQINITRELSVTESSVSKKVKKWKIEGNIEEEKGREKSQLLPKIKKIIVQKQKSDRLKTSAVIHREIVEP